MNLIFKTAKLQWDAFKASQIDTSLDLSRLDDVKRWGDFALAHSTMSRQVEAFRAPGLPGYVAYAVVEKTVIMVGDAVSDEPEPLLRGFLEWARSEGLSFCGLQMRETTARILRRLGLAINKMGVENFVALACFDPEMRGMEYAQARRLRNIARRFGVVVIERPIDLVNPCEVRRVSDDWIAKKKNRGELRLLLREISYVPEPGVRYCFLRAGSAVLGFVFFSPMYRHGRIFGYYADIERYALENIPGLPAGFNAMRFIACAFAPTAKAEGCEVLALGMSPLYEVEDSEFNDNPELTRLFCKIYDESEIYAFKGIATHKNLYPCLVQEPVYIATEPDTATEAVLDMFKGVGLLDG